MLKVEQGCLNVWNYSSNLG